MTSSRVSQFSAALAGVVLAWVFVSDAQAVDGRPGDSLAQSEAPTPRRLLPRTPVAPESPTDTTSAPAENQPASETRLGIEVNRLDGPDPQDFGTIDASSGGFERTVWGDAKVSFVAHLTGQLPRAIASPTIRDLLRRLFLSAAQPPVQDAQPPVQDAETAQINLAALRVSQLQGMGLLGSAAALLDAVPSANTDPQLRRLRVENLLMRNDVSEACLETRRPEISLAERFWQYLLVFCHAAEGNFAEASLGAGLLSEGAEPVDPVFMQLIDGFVGGETPKIDTLGTPTILLMAMFRHAKLPFPVESLESAPPPLLATVALSPETDLDTRLAAAEKAVLYGAMTTERLTSIYAAAPFSGEDLDTALSTAEAARSPRGRALLFQAAAGQNVPTARAEVLQKALDFAAEDGAYQLSIKLYRVMLESMEASVELSWFAADAARALSALGREDLARPWMNGLRYESVRSPAAKQMLDSMWVLATLARSPDESGRAFGTLADWRKAVLTIDPDPANRRIKEGMALLDIYGYPVDPEQWIAALSAFDSQPTNLPDYAYRVALDRAAAAGRVGETILLASIIFGREGPAAIGPIVLKDIVAALRSVGLEKEAHALIVEAAVGKGI